MAKKTTKQPDSKSNIEEVPEYVKNRIKAIESNNANKPIKTKFSSLSIGDLNEHYYAIDVLIRKYDNLVRANSLSYPTESMVSKIQLEKYYKVRDEIILEYELRFEKYL